MGVEYGSDGEIHHFLIPACRPPAMVVEYMANVGMFVLIT